MPRSSNVPGSGTASMLVLPARDAVSPALSSKVYCWAKKTHGPAAANPFVSLNSPYKVPEGTPLAANPTSTPRLVKVLRMLVLVDTADTSVSVTPSLSSGKVGRIPDYVGLGVR